MTRLRSRLWNFLVASLVWISVIYWVITILMPGTSNTHSWTALGIGYTIVLAEAIRRAWMRIAILVLLNFAGVILLVRNHVIWGFGWWLIALSGTLFGWSAAFLAFVCFFRDEPWLRESFFPQVDGGRDESGIMQ